MARQKGSKLSAEHKAKIAQAMRGNKNQLGKGWKWSSASRLRINGRKIKNRKKGWFRPGHSTWNKGKKMPQSMRDKMKVFATNRTGEKSANWNGGLSFLPYLPAFNNDLKLKIRTRDRFTCQLCFVKEEDYFQKLSINHIDYDKKNNAEDNLITLCRGCNAKVNFQREKWTTFFSEKILKMNAT